jgi:hypothetical protein
MTARMVGTRILPQIQEGDGAEQLLPLVYEERRKLTAQKAPGQTLQATAEPHIIFPGLIHLAWVWGNENSTRPLCKKSQKNTHPTTHQTNTSFSLIINGCTLYNAK